MASLLSTSTVTARPATASRVTCSSARPFSGRLSTPALHRMRAAAKKGDSSEEGKQAQVPEQGAAPQGDLAVQGQEFQPQAAKTDKAEKMAKEDAGGVVNVPSAKPYGNEGDMKDPSK